MEENKEVSIVEKQVVKLDNNSALEFHDEISLEKAARFAIKVKIAPDHLVKEGVSAVMSALSFCKQAQLPLVAMNEMGYIRGKITCFGSLITALAERHPDYGEHKIYYIDKEYKVINLENKNLHLDVYACVMQVRKKGQETWNEFYFTADEAQKAGLFSNNTYKKYLKDMLFHKVKQRAFNTSYATALKGIIYHEAEQYENYEETINTKRSSVNDLFIEGENNGT